MNIADLDTPALVVDLDVLERNLARVATYASEHHLRLRPHTKTHKIPELGALQIASGACGLTVAKVSEGEVMLDSGTPDLLVAYPVIGARKRDRLARIAERCSVTVALDSREAIDSLAGLPVSVLVELDVGFGRVGVRPEEVLPLAQAAAKARLKFAGLAFYPGHLRNADEPELARIDALLRQVMGHLRDAGFECSVVSGGSTPTLFDSHRVGAMNEIRPGTYIFNDRNTVLSGACTIEECAAAVVVTVVSDAVPGQVIVDGGSKTFSSDASPAGGFGIIRELPAASLVRMSEEHGFIDVTDVGVRLRIGERVRIVPNHICAAVNLHDRLYGVRGDQVEVEWPVRGRGCLQ